MVVLRARLLPLCALALLAGCSSDPDVVAHQEQATDSPDPKLVEGCRPGEYRGYFSGQNSPTDSSSPIYVTGDIRFTLELQLSGEFLQLSRSSLQGQTDGGLTFEGLVINPDSGGCQQGKFESLMIGDLQFGTSYLHFEGPVSGRYTPPADGGGSAGFDGEWNADFTDVPTLKFSGKWFAGFLERP